MKRKTDEQFKKEINDIYGNALEVLGKYKNNKEKTSRHDIFKDVTTEDLKKYGFMTS